jgi:hypothetical protein
MCSDNVINAHGVTYASDVIYALPQAQRHSGAPRSGEPGMTAGDWGKRRGTNARLVMYAPRHLHKERHLCDLWPDSEKVCSRFQLRHHK